MKFIRTILGLESLKQSEEILEEANRKANNAKKRADESYNKLLKSFHLKSSKIS